MPPRPASSSRRPEARRRPAPQPARRRDRAEPRGRAEPEEAAAGEPVERRQSTSPPDGAGCSWSGISCSCSSRPLIAPLMRCRSALVRASSGVQLPFAVPVGGEHARRAARVPSRVSFASCGSARESAGSQRAHRQTGPLDVRPGGRQIRVAALVGRAGQLELERVLQDLVRAQRERRWAVPPASGSSRAARCTERSSAVAIGVEPLARLAVPQPVLEAEEAAEIRDRARRRAVRTAAG